MTTTEMIMSDQSFWKGLPNFCGTRSARSLLRPVLFTPLTRLQALPSACCRSFAIWASLKLADTRHNARQYEAPHYFFAPPSHTRTTAYAGIRLTPAIPRDSPPVVLLQCSAAQRPTTTNYTRACSSTKRTTQPPF